MREFFHEEVTCVRNDVGTAGCLQVENSNASNMRGQSDQLEQPQRADLPCRHTWSSKPEVELFPFCDDIHRS